MRQLQGNEHWHNLFPFSTPRGAFKSIEAMIARRARSPRFRVFECVGVSRDLLGACSQPFNGSFESGMSPTLLSWKHTHLSAPTPLPLPLIAQDMPSPVTGSG
jgi:hypothetical protein